MEIRVQFPFILNTNIHFYRIHRYFIHKSLFFPLVTFTTTNLETNLNCQEAICRWPNWLTECCVSYLVFVDFNQTVDLSSPESPPYETLHRRGNLWRHKYATLDACKSHLGSLRIAKIQSILNTHISAFSKDTEAEFPNSNVATKRYNERYDNRTATCNGPFSLARAAGSTIYGYGKELR